MCAGDSLGQCPATIDMSSAKVLLCDLCVILLFGLSFILAEEKTKASTKPDEGPKGNCSCGGFPTSTPVAGSVPLLSQSPGLVTKCDDEGENVCKNLCIALATATKAKGPEILCNRLKNADELKLSAFYKTCEKPWTYAKMTAELPLCCENSKVKPCASALKAAANATAPAAEIKL
ncbi:uncharacterized protein LOC126381905 [Pectinophora gossypiella]|uniref:uncharacterized protein LOC126381905 n=1 Tax=Pectinophora gossypiella TaxID=13191 RepID=UPI00214EC1FF|nr:uncharacterized protein LOC126381905 [Pectinophora gossypiella]